MTGKMGALAFLIVRTTRNRIVKQASRVKNPRYAFALLFGLGYLYLTFLRPGAMAQASRGGTMFTAVNGTVISLLCFASIAVTWLFSRNSGSLAYLPAEVQFLLPGPLSRQQLLIYRMVRSQLVLLLNAFIWTLLLRRFGLTLSAPLRFLSAWAGFSVLSLHQLGTALVLVQPVTGVRRLAGWLMRGLIMAGIAGLIVGSLPVFTSHQAIDFRSTIDLLDRAVSAPPITTVLAPFHLVIAPLLAVDLAGWLPAFAVLLGILAAHVGWVLSMDVEFADVAVAASAKRAERMAAMRAARSGNAIAPKTTKATRQWLPLAPVGHPAIAIAWKNTMSLIRGMGTRTLVIIAAIGVPFVVMSQAMGSGKHPTSEPIAAIPYLMLVAMTMLMGPRMLRNDLRQDLLRLSTLKTYPLKGSALVAGEILSPTVALTLLQVVLLAICYLTVSGVPALVAKSGLSLALFALVPFALAAWNGVNTTIQNGLTLMFPSWVKLGADSGGVEAMGQNLLVTFGSMFALMLALLLPVGATVAMVIFMRFTAGEAALGAGIAAGTVVGILLLTGEIVAMVNIFGRTFEQIDPTAIG